MKKLTHRPGFHEIDLDAHLEELFEHDCKIFDIKPIAFPFDSPADLRKYLLEDHTTRTIILNSDDELFLGYFSFEEKLELPDFVELVNLGVMPEQQNRGVGTQLMSKYLEIVGKRDSRHVTHPDSSSRYLYEKFGYKQVKILKNYFGDGEPRLLYFRSGK